MGWVLDLDGVIWRGERGLPGAAQAVAELRRRGEQVVFATNNSSMVLADQEARLAAMGIPAAGDVVTSASACAGLVTPGERVLACAGPGVVEAVTAAGATVVDRGPAEVVVVGFNAEFDYEGLRRAHAALAGGARFVATNTDATYPTPGGEIPGAGALVAAVATAAGRAPIVAGKPHPPMVDLVRARLGPAGTVVGDRAETDGAFAIALGYRFALVLSGVTAATDLPVHPEPAVIATSLASLVLGSTTG